MGDSSHLLSARRVREIADCFLGGEEVHERRMAGLYCETVQNTGTLSVYYLL